jgi:glycerate 2-kinase
VNELKKMRADALALFQAGLRAADPARAVLAHQGDLPQPAPGGRLMLLAVGKAARAMAEAALSVLPGPVEALVVTNAENDRPLAGAQVMAAGHPVPDAAGVAAGAEVMRRLEAAGPDDRVLALISGGGSALLPAPVDGVTLEDKAEVNRLLLASGWDITAMNSVRQHLSRLKGGGMLRLAAPAPVTALILSDVVGDDLRVIASGPTVGPIAAKAAVVERLHREGLWERLPFAAQQALLRPPEESPPPHPSPQGGGGRDDLMLQGEGHAVKAPVPLARNILIGSNALSLQAMAAMGAQVIQAPLVGDVEQAARRIADLARQTARPALLALGGETTVRLQGKGLGGRNQELALRVALAGMPGDWVFLSGGTDGRDGPTDAAGGIVDPDTGARIRAKGGDPNKLLANNDSYHALQAAGDLLIIGPTGTNVADLQVLLLA